MTDTQGMTQAALAPMKYSRYAKVRRAQTLEQQAPELALAPAQTPTSAPKTDTIARSMSRYKKNRPRAPTVSQAAAIPATPILSDNAQYNGRASSGDVVARNRENSNSYSQYPTEQQPAGREQRSNSNHMSNRSSGSQPIPRLVQRMSDQQAKKFMESQVSQDMIDLQQRADETERAQAAQKLLEKSKREDLARLEATLAAAAPQPVRGRAESKSTWNKLSSFGRKMSKPRVSPPTSAAIAERKISVAQDLLSKSPDQRVVAGCARVDAPKSEAVEGRRVDVRFGDKRKQFAVQKTTTAGDIISVAVMVFKTHFQIDAAVLKESYRSDGLHLERRLRLYELVAPVMNSWDRDTQNELVLEASDSPRHDMDLLARGAPQERPGSTSAHMYHSYRKGRWMKHWVTLRADGQIFLSKTKPEAGRVLKEVRGIAHMSDFDIYTLTEEQLKALKPKRRHACVVKSQQKQTLFESNQENFVHFFSTGHSSDYQEWIDACQSWRSWYLSKEAKDCATTATVPVSHNRAYDQRVHGQVDCAKNSSVPHQSASYQPLSLNTSFGNRNGDRYDSGDERQRKDSRDFFEDESDYRSPISPHQSQTRQIPFHLRNGDPTHISSAPISLEPFHQGGLLGRSYSQRQKQMNDPRMAGNLDFHTGAFMSHGLLAQGANGHGFANGSGQGGLVNGAHANGNVNRNEGAGAGNGYISRPSTSHNNSAHNTPHTYAADSLRRPSFANSRPGTAGSGGGGNGSFGGPGIPPVPDIPDLKPLVDIKPQFQEAPQWRGEGKGRGVRVPEGVPLVDAAGSRRVEREGKEYHPEEFRRTNTLKGGYR